MNEDTPKYTIPQACGILGLNASQIHKWIRQKYIIPEGATPAKGRPNLLSYNDLVRLSLLKLLGEYRMLGAESGPKVAGYLVGRLSGKSLNRPVLTIGPDPGNGTSWSTRADGPPGDDEPFVVSFNLAQIRGVISKKLR